MSGERRSGRKGGRGRTLMKMNKLIVFAAGGFAAIAGFAAEPSDARGKSDAESAPVEFAGFCLGQVLDSVML